MKPIITLAALLIATCSYEDQVEVRIATLDEARGAIRRGVVPACLPPSTRDITMLINVDLNASYGRFAFRPEDSAQFALLAPVLADDLARERVNRPRAKTWWHPELIGRLDAKKLARSNLRFYRCPINDSHSVYNDFFVAIDEQRSTGYFWTT